MKEFSLRSLKVALAGWAIMIFGFFFSLAFSLEEGEVARIVIFFGPGFLYMGFICGIVAFIYAIESRIKKEKTIFPFLIIFINGLEVLLSYFLIFGFSFGA